MTRVLLTGFDAFDGASENPSWSAAQCVADEWDGEAGVVAERLPVEFARSVTVLADAVERHRPDIVIATGLAAGRTAISVERRGLNRDDARIPDATGAQPRGPIDPDGPPERPSTLPVDAIVAALMRVGIPAEASVFAGAYVCNHLLYRMGEVTPERVRVGFVHVPATPETGLGATVPTLPTAMVASAIRIAVGACVAELGEVPAAGAVR